MNMKQTMKRSLALILILLTVVFPVSAAEAAETDLFAISYAENCIKELRIVGDEIQVRGVPGNGEYSSFLMELEGSGGTYSQYADREVGAIARFSLAEVPAGTYSLVLMSSDNEKRAYTQCVETLTLRWRGGGGGFVLSGAWALNQSRAGEDRCDDKTRAYFLRAGDGVESDNQEIRSLAAAITRNCGSAYEKTRAIHDWVADNIYYDYDAVEGRTEYGSQSALAVLHRKRGVCAGYSYLTTALLRAAGVPARYVTGYALTGSETYPASVLNGGSETNHAWTEAWADGRWVIMDTTWDSGNDWEYGCAKNSDGCDSHRYFDIAPETFALDHAVVNKPLYREMQLYVGSSQYASGGTWKPCTDTGASPVIIQDTVMVPVLTLIQELGGSFEWNTTDNPGWSRLYWSCGGSYVNLWLESKGLDAKTFYANGKEYRFDVAPRLVNGVTMVQVRPLMEAMGGLVDWDAGTGRGMVSVCYGG